MAMTRHEWIERLAGHLAAVCGALTETSAAVAAGGDAPRDGWVATLSAPAGSLTVEFDGDAAQAMTARILGLDGSEAAEPMVIDTLKEIAGQAAGALVLEPAAGGVKLTADAVKRATAAPVDAVVLHITLGSGQRVPLRIWGAIEAARADQPAAPAATPAGPDPKLDVILDIDLPLVVRFGRTELPLRSLAGLGPGSVIDLGRAPDEPVEVLVSNQVVARGEVVVVSGNYGVRITDVISPAERVRSMEVSV